MYIDIAPLHSAALGCNIWEDTDTDDYDFIFDSTMMEGSQLEDTQLEMALLAVQANFAVAGNRDSTIAEIANDFDPFINPASTKFDESGPLTNYNNFDLPGLGGSGFGNFHFDSSWWSGFEDEVVVTGEIQRREPVNWDLIAVPLPNDAFDSYLDLIHDAGDVEVPEPEVSPCANAHTLDELINMTGFDGSGQNELSAALSFPVQALIANHLAQQAKEAAIAQFGGTNFGDNAADAFRHAYWVFTMTQALGAGFASLFSTAHEVTNFQQTGVVTASNLMDLYNNTIGMTLALQNPDGDATELIMDAIANGQLITDPPSNSPDC